MELPVQPSSNPSRGRNIERAPWCYLLWGVPVVLAVGASAAYGASVLSITARGVLWVAAVAWSGTGCLINGRSCGRVHCRIDGILFPILSIVGALNVLSVISFNWNLFWLAFLIILVASFVPEYGPGKSTPDSLGSKGSHNSPYPITITPIMKGAWP